MITGVRNDLTPLAKESLSRKGKSGDDASFADQLFASREDRTERMTVPGRADNPKMSREGMRKEEREPSPETDEISTQSRPKRETNNQIEKRKVKRQEPEADPASRGDQVGLPRREDLSPVRVERQEEPVSDDSLILKETRSRVGEGSGGAAGQSTSAFFSVPTNVKSDVAMGSSSVEAPATETLQMLAQIRDQQSQTRQSAIAEFVTKMQSEAGVSPEKILEAFAKMDEKALMATPEESMDTFLANLEIPGKQKVAAAELYATMLKQTKEAELSSKLAGMDSGVKFDVMSVRDESLRKLNNSLDDMNKTFFMNGQASNQAQTAVERMDSELARLMEQSQRQKLQSGQLESSLDAKSGDSNLMALGLGSAAAESTDLASSSDYGDVLQGSDGIEKDDEISAELSEAAELAKELNLAGTEMDGGSASTQESSQSVAAMKAADKSGKGDKSMKVDETSLRQSGSDASQAFGEVQGMSGPDTKAPGASGPSAMLMGRPLATPQDEQANVRELIRQAQLVLKKGGGEMQMELKPEGMGQVKMKVNVENGQVNVEMLTDNDQAKRLLEKGLNELKMSLSAQNLRVDNLKVDVGSEIQKQMDFNQEQSREQARQFAQDFMGQFRDDRQAFRQGMMENPGLRTYNKSQSRGMDPEPVVSGYNRSSPRADGTKRLNLVA